MTVWAFCAPPFNFPVKFHSKNIFLLQNNLFHIFVKLLNGCCNFLAFLFTSYSFKCLISLWRPPTMSSVEALFCYLPPSGERCLHKSSGGFLSQQTDFYKAFRLVTLSRWWLQMHECVEILEDKTCCALIVLKRKWHSDVWEQSEQAPQVTGFLHSICKQRTTWAFTICCGCIKRVASGDVTKGQYEFAAGVEQKSCTECHSVIGSCHRRRYLM